MERAMGTFEQRYREESEYAEAAEGPRLVRVQVTHTFTGQIEGEGIGEQLVLYSDTDAGSYTGLERVTGRIDGRSGSFVLQHSGIFGAGAVQASWFVVAGSGTAELAGLAGEGAYVGDPEQGDTIGFALDYLIDSGAPQAESGEDSADR